MKHSLIFCYTNLIELIDGYKKSLLCFRTQTFLLSNNLLDYSATFVESQHAFTESVQQAFTESLHAFSAQHSSTAVLLA